MVNNINTNIKAIKRAMVEDAADLVPTPDDKRVVWRIVAGFHPLNFITNQLSRETSPTVSSEMPKMEVIKTATYAHKVKGTQSQEYRNKVCNCISEKCVNTLTPFSTHFYPLKILVCLHDFFRWVTKYSIIH